VNSIVYYSGIAAIFRFCTVSMHDVGNHNMGKSVVKSQGNVREFHVAGEYSPCVRNL